jgi:isopentenyl diphosphate isomerase/L-lactate dehydrogenase-like FMN-dependent dehydrogenase
VASDGVSVSDVSTFLNVWDYERAAAERIPPGPLAYYAAGAGDEWTLRENVSAYRRWVLRPRVLREVDTVSTETTVLGSDLSMPILVAPMAYQRHAHPDGECATAEGAAAAGTLMCMSTMATASPADVCAAAPDAPRWFQLYVFRDAGVTRGIVEQAVDAGFRAIVLTVDAPVFGRRERDIRTGWEVPAEPAVPALVAALGVAAETSVTEHFKLVSPLVGWKDVERIASEAGLPVLVKGIHTAEDALLAVEAGAAGIVVSNHGGRQLDGVAATIDVLPEAVEAVGARVPVLVDGGIRRGIDVAVALALGADAVLVGRPALWGLAVDGAAGVRSVLELLRAELELALGLLGCATPAEVDRTHVARAR